MRLFYLLSFIITFIISNDCFSQQQKLLFCSEYYNPHQQQFVNRNKLENVYVIYQDKILTKTGEIDKKRFKESIVATIPNKYQYGYGVLDVEDENYYIVSGFIKTTNEKYNKALKEFLSKYIEILNFAKTIRPNLKWSFFDLQPTIYLERPISFSLLVNNIMPLLEKVDFLAPALYLTSTYTVKEQLYFIETNVRNSIRLGNSIKKPIYPFIWHRYGLNNKKNAMKKIEKRVFINYVSNVLNTEYNHRKVNGIIWWNGESGGYLNRKKFQALNNEYRNIDNYSEYQIRLLQNYLNSIKSFF